MFEVHRDVVVEQHLPPVKDSHQYPKHSECHSYGTDPVKEMNVVHKGQRQYRNQSEGKWP